MKHHPLELVNQIRVLRSTGKTYKEINTILKIKLAKSTLSWICKSTPLPQNYQDKISAININNLGIARATAIAVRQMKRTELLSRLDQNNSQLVKRIADKAVAKIALAMLCLGEASKSTGKHAFSLGSSDPRIITLFIELMDKCYCINRGKIRCTVQQRADQDTSQLIEFWSTYTGIPTTQFYKTQIDKRTIGKPTKNLHYKGVLNVYYQDKTIQIDLESLADLAYNCFSGPVVH